MNITNSADLTQALHQGQHLQLNSQGGIETQSGISRFFQSIGDAFRSLSASGREAIEARNARLGEAVSRMLSADDALPNLSQIDVPPKNEALNPVVNKFVARSAAHHYAKDYPENIRGRVVEILQNLVASDTRLEGKPDHIRFRTGEFAKAMLVNKDIMAVLNAKMGSDDPAKLEAMKDGVKERLIQNYNHFSGNLTKSVEAAANAGELKSINGQPPQENCRSQVKALVPNSETLFNFIQQGCLNKLSEALSDCLRFDMSPNDLPLGKAMGDLVRATTTNQSYEISTEGNVMTVKVAVEREYVYDGFVDGGKTPNGLGKLGSERYEMTVKFSLDQLPDKRDQNGFLDITQDMDQIPEFTITDIKHTALS